MRPRGWSAPALNLILEVLMLLLLHPLLIGLMPLAWADDVGAAERAEGYAQGLAAVGPPPPGLPLLSGALGAGAPAGLGLLIGGVSALGAPVLGGLACGALGCVSVAWAWEMAPSLVPPAPPELASPAWLEGYEAGHADGVLRARRRWVYLAGAIAPVALAGAYVGATAWIGARAP